MTNASSSAPPAPADPGGDTSASAGSASSERFRDVVAGVVFVGFGGAFAVGALGYDIGTTLEPGPGYYPMVLGVLLAVLGLAVVVNGLLRRGHDAPDEVNSPAGPDAAEPDAAGEADDLQDTRGRVPWIAAVLIIGAIVGFAFAVRTLGLVPAVFGCAFVAALAGYRRRVHAALAVAAVLTAICYVIFVLLLQLRIPEFGTLFTG
ncbi:MAG: tripartite tricarboxylate transporter TctB family protein [Dermatophilaceae bacterium]